MIRHFEKVQFVIESRLAAETSLVVAEPVAFTHQIAQSPGRFTIVGFFITDGVNEPPVDRLTQPAEIHSGTIPGEVTDLIEEIPRGGDLARGQDPLPRTDTRVMILKDLLDMTLSGISGLGEVFFMDFNGVEYGQIPNRKGFRSFPA